MTANGYAELAALLARGFRQLRVVNDCADEQRLIDTFSKPKAPTVLRFNLVAGSRDYYSALAAADVLLRVDPGMTFLLRRLGLAPGLDMSGTDFIPKLLAAFSGGGWGWQEPFWASAVQRREALFSANVVSAEHGFAEVEHS